MKSLDNLILLIVIFFSTLSYAGDEVLFTISNKPITTIDLDQRLIYLGLLSDINKDKINEKDLIKDLISIKLFDEFVKKKRLNIQEKEIKKYFDVIYQKNQKNIEDLIIDKKLTNEIILKNIRYDLQRKKTIELLLDDRINEIYITSNNQNIIDIYNIEINYLIIAKEYKNEINNFYDKLLKKEIDLIKNYLNNTGIEYEFFSKKIINLDRLNKEIKKIIIENKNSFFIDEKNYILVGIVKKNLKKDIDLKYSFFQIKVKKNINFEIITNEFINCNNIKQKLSDSRLEIKEFKSINIENLNINIFQNFAKENERLIIKNNKQKMLILVCKIDYNKEIAKDKTIENNLIKIADEIEKDFIQKYKNEFNLQLFN